MTVTNTYINGQLAKAQAILQDDPNSLNAREIVTNLIKDLQNSAAIQQNV